MSGLPLNRWLAIMGFNPWHSYQLANSTIPVTSDCNTLVREYAWQSADRASRSEIRRVIEHAEQLLHEYTHVWPTPRFREVTLPYPAMGDTRLQRAVDVGSDGRWLSLVLDEGAIQALGAQTTTTIDSAAALSYTDEDGDGLAETATATVTVPSGTLPSELVCQFVAADVGPLAESPTIAPRTITITDTSAVIVCDAWTLVRPVLYTGAASGALNPAVLPPTSGTPFAATIAVTRERADPTGTTTDTAMAVLTWETRPWPFWATCCAPSGGADSDPAATATALARAVIRDAASGVVAFGQATYDADSGTWSGTCDWSRCRPPDRVTIRYQAGIAYDGIQMRDDLAVITARLAAAELARPICACTSANRELYEWQTDLSRTGASDELFSAPNDLTNPIGSRRGHLFAWRWITRTQRTTGVYAG